MIIINTVIIIDPEGQRICILLASHPTNYSVRFPCLFIYAPPEVNVKEIVKVIHGAHLLGQLWGQGLGEEEEERSAYLIINNSGWGFHGYSVSMDIVHPTAISVFTRLVQTQEELGAINGP